MRAETILENPGRVAGVHERGNCSQTEEGKYHRFPTKKARLNTAEAAMVKDEE